MHEKLCGIYCIENIVNNKKYIGMSRNIKRRWSEHKSHLNSNIHVNKYLQSAWNKYGENNFKFYIIETCNEDKLGERECYYIQFYHTLSHENGYNLTVGGENTSIGKPVINIKNNNVYKFVYEAATEAGISTITMINWCRQKQNYMYLSEYNSLTEEEQEYWKNYNWEENIHLKLSKAHSRENMSEETLNKYKEITSGENNPRAIKVYCPQLNEFFNCIKYAADKYKVNRGSISQCLKGKLKSAGKHPITGEKLTWEIVENDIKC